MTTTNDARNDRNRRIGQTFSIYLHFEEKDAIDNEASERGETANAVIRRAIRQFLGLASE